jgi:hypothetical protein
LVGGTAGALAAGAPLSQALRGGLISGVAGGLGAGFGKEFGLGDTGTSLLSAGLSTGLQSALAPSGSRALISATQQPAQAGQPTVARPVGGVTAGQTGGTLGGSLTAAPSGYVPGGAVFGTSDTEKPPSNVWNTASLRNIGEENA